jgi:hypothetical protein
MIAAGALFELRELEIFGWSDFGETDLRIFYSSANTSAIFVKE